MIGLGSNRLSVCRRGGMSVTQAGKGGMEWLAGGRMPSWASPYSVQATAALKAQFPTQWPTIRDYGFAHPALVPFINEDPMLVCSLIPELGYVRILYSEDGEVNTQWIVTTNTQIDFKFQIVEASSYGQVIANYIDEQHAKTYIGRDASKTGSLLIQFRSMSYEGYNVGSIYNLIEGYLKKQQCKLNNNTYTIAGENGNENTNPLKICKGVKTKSYYVGVKDNGELKQMWYPCKHIVNGELKAGMLDIVNLHWEQHTGTASISETPAS